MNNIKMLQDYKMGLKILGFLYRVVPVQFRPEAPNTQNTISERAANLDPYWVSGFRVDALELDQRRCSPTNQLAQLSGKKGPNAGGRHTNDTEVGVK